MDEVDEFRCVIFIRFGESILFVMFEFVCKGELG